MKRKDFRKAAEIIRGMNKMMRVAEGGPSIIGMPTPRVQAEAMAFKIDVCKLAYIMLFRGDPLFDEEWFKRECE